MSYSHDFVKERTAPPGCGDRTWNVFRHCRDIPAYTWVTVVFDMTLGFPGEGPKWSIISANVDSFATSSNCLQWDADAFMLQEARVAESNLADSQRKAAMFNFQLFCSQPLQKFQLVMATTGSHREDSYVCIKRNNSAL